jgi:hypothetical protein
MELIKMVIPYFLGNVRVENYDAAKAMLYAFKNELQYAHIYISCIQI